MSELKWKDARILIHLVQWSERRCARAASQFSLRWASTLSVPSYFLEILILVEDKRFARHLGVDPIGIIRALRHNLGEKAGRQGASTLAQQLYGIRLNRVPDKSYKRTLRAKLVQAAFGIWITQRLSRANIIEEYMGSVYWGRSFYGVKEASRGYFDKVPSCLSVEESFFLVERLASPHRFSPKRLAVIIGRTAIKNFLAKNGSSPERIYGFYDLETGHSDNLPSVEQHKNTATDLA